MCLPLRLCWSLALVVALLSLSGCGETPAAATPAAPKVTVQPPTARELTDFAEYNGWIDASKTVEIRARVRGHIHKVNFSDGQMVKADTVLFELDPRPFQSDIERANEQLNIYKAQHVAAVKDEVRLRELLGKGGASQAQVEKAEADALSLAAQISGAEEEIRRRELELSYAKIPAEIDGRVGRAMLQVGNLVNAGGSDPLLTSVVATTPVLVYFNVDERILLQYARNMGAAGLNATEMIAKLKDVETPFTFSLDGETEFAHKGVLRFGDNRIDPTTGTLQVYGEVDNKDGKLLPGGRVRARVPVGKAYNALLVPETAILADQDKRYVLIADKDNVVRRRNVVLGRLTDDGLRAIRPEGGVDEKDPPAAWNVLVDNLQRARLNYPIDPQKPAVAASAPSNPAAPTPATSTPATPPPS